MHHLDQNENQIHITMLKSILPKLLAGICLLATFHCFANPAGKNTVPVAKMLAHKQASVSFTENIGQVADITGKPRADVLFTAHSGSTNIYLTATGISYQFARVKYPAGYDPSGMEQTDPLAQADLARQTEKQTCNFSLSLEGANPNPKITRLNKSSRVEHYYMAQCPNGLTNVPVYGKIVYHDVYPDIDWIVYGSEGRLKYDFIVRAGGDPSKIKLKIKDAEQVNISKAGELVMKTVLGEVREKSPVSFSGGKTVPTHFRQNADGTIGFEVAAYTGNELRIDPSVIWSSYYGGSGTDYSYTCITDATGNIYIAGYTTSTTGIASGGFQNTYGGGTYDAFMAKLDSAGYPIWTTYYGGTGDDYASGLTRDPSGNIYLAGYTTTSTNLASGGFQNAISPGATNNAYLAKFTPAGTRIWGTYYSSGTTGAATMPVNGSQPICTDGSGNVYFTGLTNTAGLSSGGFQNTIGGGQDAYLVKFDAAGNRLWATYYGGASGDNGYSCSTDGSGNVYMVGQASSTGLASGGFQNALNGSFDMLVVKFDPSGSRLWATYFGGSGSELATACVADNAGNLYVGGNTTSTGIASGGYQGTLGGSTDALLVKFGPTGNRLWATYYGGTGADQFRGAVLDAAGNIYLSGITGSATAIGNGGFQNTLGGGNDAMLVKFTAAGGLVWGSYLGGSATEGGFGCAPDASGNVFVTGYTGSAAGVSLPGTYQPVFGGGSYDGFLAKVGDIGLFTGTVTGSPFCSGSMVSVPFTLFGNYNANNIFTAQLSDATGSFIAPVNIGTLAGTAAGTITATIPAATPAGTGYRIRVVSSSPAIIAPNNGTDITVSGSSVTPTVTIAANPGNVICGTVTVTFTATATDTGTAPVYQWKKNGTNVGTNSRTYSDNALSNNDVITLVMTSNAPCISAATVTSNAITMTVGTAVTPTVSITANPGNNICAGTPVTFTASGNNTGTAPVYYWRKNGVNVGGNTATYTDNALANNDVISVRLTSNANCRTVDTVNSNAVTMTVNASVAPSVTIAANPGNTICAGTSVTFTPTPVNGGSTPSYEWKNGPLTVSTSPVYTTTALSTGDVITVIMTSNAGCAVPATATSPGITMTVNPAVAPTVSVTANPGNAVCSGTSVTFTATTTNGGASPNFVWKKGATTVGSNTPTYTDNTLATGDVITVTLTSNAACAVPASVTSTGITMTVSPAVTPTVTLTASPGNTICSGTPVTFTAVTTNGGTAPGFVWKKGIAVVGGSGATYTDNSLVNGDVITVTLNSSAACATPASVTSSGITMSVNNSLVPDINIVANPAGPICAGTAVTFTATGVNGGTTPVYQWVRNGIASGTSVTYSSASLNNNDTIMCVLGSSLSCVTKPTDTSNKIIVKVEPSIPPTIAIFASPGTTITPGTNVTFTAVVTNGGTTPAYQWKRNGINVGTNSASYSSNTLVSNDTITCVVISSNTCAAPANAASNQLIMKISTGIGQVAGSGNDITLYPNPNNGLFTVKGTLAGQDATMEVLSMVGQMVYRQPVMLKHGELNETIQLPDLAPGAYLLRVKTEHSTDVLRFVLNR